MRLLAAALVLLTPLAAAGPRRIWELTPFTFIKRSHAEPGAPGNSQPLVLEPAALARALATLQFQEGREQGPLFLADEAELLAKPLAEALALAGPDEDLEVLSTNRRSDGFMANPLAVTARIFVRAGRLNIIVHDARLDYMPAYSYAHTLPDFQFGSRTRAGAVALKAEGAEQRRGDWLALPLAAAPPAPAQTTLALPPGPAAPPSLAASAAAPAERPATEAASVEQRLRDLKRFREQDLITEAEYVKQKQELLQEFSKGGRP
jgi:hypothetical protein